MRKQIIAGILIFGITLISSSEYRIERVLEKRSFRYNLLYLPSGKYLKIASLGFGHLVADIIYIWSIQFYSNYEITYRYDYLEHIYAKIIPELDPNYLDPYLIGALIMAVEKQDVDMALRLLDRGIALNPDKWILAYDAGMYCFQMRDYGRAAYYFDKAMRAPDVHPSVKRMYAGMFEKMGDKATAYQFWREIYESSYDYEYARNIAWMHIHDLKIEIDIETIHNALIEFKEKYGRFPSRLNVLIREGLLRQIPVDPNGKEYIYDRRKGAVKPATPLILKR